MTPRASALAVSLSWFLAADHLAGQDTPPETVEVQLSFARSQEAATGPTDPTKAEVPLETASPDWRAFLVIDNGDVGIWTVKPFQVFPQYACPEVVGLDDQGRCLVMVSYSGKWTPNVQLHDHKWLGGLTHGEVDPRVQGRELYAGGQNGNLFQITAAANGSLDARRIGSLPGREVHTLLVDPFTRGDDGALLVFTRPGALYRLRPDADHGGFSTELVCELPGRVRDATVLAAPDGGAPVIATVSRAGRLELVESVGGELRWTTVHETTMGMGRIVRRPGGSGAPLVLYTTLDDGRVMRHERGAAGWGSEVIYLGPQGPRGVAAGRFDADPDVETVAVFGYSAKVQMLSRRPGGPWTVETLFVDRDKGHWLNVAELDGRNATDELVASGYGGRIVLLSRPVGYGLPAVPKVGDDGAGD